MSFLQLSGVSRREEGTFLVRDVSFKQEKNRKLAIAGATGSGKTTLLKMIAGLIQPSEGAVFFEGQKVQGPEERLLPGHPGIAYLSQHFELR
ncbi:MAG: ATP-binding cassette domain-containing protein, partial [Flavisolibacter sp.]